MVFIVRAPVGIAHGGEGDREQGRDHCQRNDRRARPLLARLGGVGDQDRQRGRIAAAEIEWADEIAEGEDEAEQRRDDEPHPCRGHDDLEHGAQPAAAQIVRRLDQRPVDEHRAEQLQEHDEREAQGQIADHGPEIELSMPYGRAPPGRAGR